MAMAFGLVLKELRTQYNLNPSQAATRVGISSRRWRRYEKGRQVPYLSHLFQFGPPLDVDPVSLLKHILRYRDELKKQRAP